MSLQNFKRLLLLTWVTHIVAVILWFSTERYLPQELQSYLDGYAATDLTVSEWLLGGVGGILSLMNIVVWIGLYRIRPWARKLLIPVTLASLLLSLFCGPAIMHSVVSALCSLALMMAGAVIVAAYVPPVSHEFSRRESEESFK